MGDEVFIVPIASVMESFQPQPGQMPPLGGQQQEHLRKLRRELVKVQREIFEN